MAVTLKISRLTQLKIRISSKSFGQVYEIITKNAGFKIPRLNGRAGSSPAPGTI